MGFADYLSSLNLDPAHAARLQGMVDTPPPNMSPANAPPPPADDAANYGPPTPAEMAKYGATPKQIGIAQAANGAATAGTANIASPTAQPSWSPEKQEQRETAAKEASAADSPQDLGDQGRGEREQPATPGRYVAAHWQPGTRSEAIKYGMDPDKLAPADTAMDAAEGHGLAAGEERLKAAQQEGMADAVYAASHAAAAKQAAEQMQRLQNEKESYVAREQDKLTQLNVAASQKVDPDAARGSAGGQILAAIGVAMGAFGSSITGGQNTALQIVNANIDRNIKAQEANIASAKQSVGAEQNLYKQNLDAFGDRERAVLATKMQYLEQVKAMGDQQYAGAANARNIAAKHEWDQKILQQSAQWKTEFAKLTDDERTTQGNEHYVPGQMVGGGGPKKNLENLVTLPDGTTVQMPNEKQADAAIGKVQVIDRLQRYNNEALRVRAEIKKLDPLMDRTAYNTAHKQLEDLEETKASLLSTEAGQGVLRDSEYARSVARQGFYTQGVGFFKGNPLAHSEQETADANIRRQIARGNEDALGFVKGAGGHIVKRGYATDASGQKVPVAQYEGKDIKPAEQLPPKGFKPLKKGDENNPTADDSLEDTTPNAPNFGFIPSAPAGAPKVGKGRK